MLRSKMLVVSLAAAALGIGAAWALPNVLPAKSTVESPVPVSAPAESTQNLIRIDGERSELRLGGKDTALDADKDGVRLRTSIGKIDLRW